jgi:hypothetical protein
MTKRIIGIALAAALIGYLAMPVQAEAAGYKSKSSSSSSRGIGRSGPYTRPATTPKYTDNSAVKSKPNTPYSGQSATDGYRKPNTPYNGAQTRPRTYPAPKHSGNTTVIQKNYYNGGSSNYNRGGGSYGGGYGGGSGGAGVGTAILGGAAGAVGGMMLIDALTEDEGEKALKLQQEQKIADEAKAQQERDDKQDQILEGQKEIEQRQEQMIPEPSDDFFKVNPNVQ